MKAHLDGDGERDERPAERSIEDQGSATGAVETEQLRAAQMALIHGLSHDLRAPLRIAKSFGELLKKQSAEQLDERGRTYLDYVIEATSQLSHRLDALLTISRLSTAVPVFQPVNVSKIFQNVANDELSDAIRLAKVDVRVGVLGVARAVPTQLRLLAKHLLENAIIFRAADREVVVAVQPEPSDPSWLKFSVTDNGIGILPQNTECIFDLFRQLHPRTEYPGEGTGLAVSRKIVEVHGGTIRCESAAGEFTKFIVSLPRCTSSNEPSEE